MSLKCGIVGLPNVGKSTLFNALTKAGIAAENYPFCTIEPNVGMVEVPDPRRSEADKVQSIQVGTKRFRKVLSSFCPGGMVSIVMISEALLLRATATDGRILRDRVLSGFGVRASQRPLTDNHSRDDRLTVVTRLIP